MSAWVILQKCKKATKKVSKIIKKACKWLYKKVFPFDSYIYAKPNKYWKTQYAKYVQTQPVEANWVLYESHVGIGMVCNPLAIFKAFQKTDAFKDYLHIWVIADVEELERLRKKYKKCKNVLFVQHGSNGYAYFTAKSKYLINNTSFNPCFHKRAEQVYLNTWHSITVKSLGYETPDGPRVIKNMLRNMLMADYIISANEFMTDIYDNSFRLRDIYPGKYIEEGYPRNDLTTNTDRQEIIQKLEERGTIVDHTKKIILYAPTWSGNNANNPAIDMSKYNDLYAYLCEHIDTNQYQILVKPHPVVYRRLTAEERKSGRYVSYTIDANELLSVVDILITDYSSIFFDFLMSRRPILFYIPDYEKYSETRGIYFKLNELPGPCSVTLEDLAERVNHIDDVVVEYKPIYDKTCSWACKYDNGKVSEKILDIIFNDKREYNIKTSATTNKERVLINVGSLSTNGVTSAVLSLLKAIDYSKYDVSAFAISLSNTEQNANFDKIPSNVRVILRVSPPALTKEEKEIYNRMLAEGIPEDGESLEKLKSVMRNEYVRIFGDACFDHIIDFSGYAPYFTALTVLGCNIPTAKHYMWQHSDMYQDYTNKVKIELNQNRVTIETLKSCYALVDKVVSCTSEVYKSNKKMLATPETEHKFTYCTNLMDQDRFVELAKEENIVCHSDSIEYIQEVRPNGVKSSTIFPLKPKQIKFVTMGRCMPEKNHEGIIRAIKRLCDEGYDVAIYIIGDGHLREYLEELAEELDITDRVFITRVLQNPMALLKRCDCFVFPSIYEAQGLAVLEARVAGLPIIVNNYAAVASVLLDDKQFILKGTDVDSIYESMMAFIRGEIPCDYTFSVEEYNKQGIADFDKLLS